MGSKKDFYTRTRANEGIVIKLFKPNGDDSDDWLRVRGVESDAFREAEANEHRELMRIGQLSEEQERKDAAEVNGREWKLRLLSSLVSEWSFDEPCTVEAVRELFREAPQILDKVERVADDRERFFGPRLSSLSPMQSTNSDKESPSKEQTQASDST